MQATFQVMKTGTIHEDAKPPEQWEEVSKHNNLHTAYKTYVQRQGKNNEETFCITNPNTGDIYRVVRGDLIRVDHEERVHLIFSSAQLENEESWKALESENPPNGEQQPKQEPKKQKNGESKSKPEPKKQGQKKQGQSTPPHK
jgi:hypothetical protein